MPKNSRKFMPKWAHKRTSGSQLAQTRLKNKRMRWAILLDNAAKIQHKDYIHMLDNAFKWEQQTGLPINEYSTNELPYRWQKTE